MKLTTLKSGLQTIKPAIRPPHTERLRGRAAMTATARIKERDLYTCQQCGRITTELEVDHIVPLWKGGADTDANKQSLCAGPDGCHAKKTAREAAERASQGQCAGL
jgi:5-methylcytosine-specific restriction protein A